ncbi:glycosyltransferase family protein [Neobacillus sp. NRS-1170]|uniref:glycosyltransferase family protein n=1 Tax=Neobacillus sp. NRS-1170 TaxID=3233898 RepID=UPI003D2C13EA
MKTIAYYISDYGYGHASRSIAVIRKLHKEAELKIIICHSFALPFIKESLGSERVSYRKIKTDIGYFLEKDSILPDKSRLLEEYKSFVSNWDNHIQQEKEFLRKNHVDLVISDISPLPFEAAHALGIPSVGLSNFTWYTAYQGLIDDQELKTFKEAYQKMTFYFPLAGSQEQWDITAQEYGFFSREIEAAEVQRIRQLVNPNEKKKIVFLGLGMKIAVDILEKLPIWNSPNCVFLVSSNVEVNRSNVFHIPNDYLESQNFIAAADLVISKAGWGMIGEALNAGIPLLILNRPSMKEDRNTIHYLKQHQLCQTLDWDDFKTYQVDISMIDKQARELKESHSFFNNDAAKIAADLLGIII